MVNVDAQNTLTDLRHVLGAAAPEHAADDIALAAFWLLQAESLALPEFGIRMLARELERLEGAPDTLAAPTPEPSVIGAVDATGVPGMVALASGVRLASESATAHGVGLLGIRGAGALGILGLAARSLAAKGLVALIAAQSPAAVAPWGGRAAAIGTNPLAVAVPRDDGPPLVVDYATSALTLAAVREASGRGERLPEETAIDAAGAMTTDPAAVAALLPTALVGSLTGLVVELLAGVAVGGRGDDEGGPATRGALIIAFDPTLAGGAGAPAAASALDRAWRAAGGHLPARFDSLSAEPSGLPGTLDIDPGVVQWLRGRLDGNAPA